MISNSHANIGYSGTLKIKINKNRTTIAEKVFTNNGTDRLFKFFCYCIQGMYNTAEELRPFKVKLFKNPAVAPGSADPKDTQLEFGSAFVATNKPATLAIVEGHPKVTIHFLIPYTAILIESINQVSLYSTRAVDGDEFSDMLAYYYFAKDINGTKVWDPIQIDANNKNNYSLIIEWTMSFDNITIE